jgi:hypothetical protein
MAAGTFYLDADDEITSAAARIRSSDATKVGLVVPYGSRISTSRMNFRLLSREAVVNNRRLSIIAGDPATRALAASAGLPVFATVGEYESALAGPPPTDGDGGDAETIFAGAPFDGPAANDGAAPAERATAERPAPRPAISDATEAIALPAVAPVATAAAASTVPMTTLPVAGPSARADTGGAGARFSVPWTVGRYRVGTPVLVGAAVTALALVVVAVGAALILPAATITVTPRQEEIGPIPLTVTADPDAPAVDIANQVVPAIRLEVPLDVNDTFNTAGKRTETIAATGTVTFRNVDFTATNTIPEGSVVSTPNGTKFSTDRSVTVAKATLVGLQVEPSYADVGVTAAKKGTAGNVEPNTITVIPPGEDPVTLTVRNQKATSGGARNVFPKINQEDVDKALAALHAKLDEAFAAAVAAGAGAPAPTTLFPATATLGDAIPSVDPGTLVGQEVETFDLGLSATGTVIAVDASPVQDIAEARLVANVSAGYRLVDGSDHVDHGDPVVTGGVVTFPVSARAAQVRVLDPEALRTLVKGQSVDQARALLSPYGEVAIDTWPAWVSSITGFDARLTVSVGGHTADGPGSSPSGGPSSGSPRASTGTATSASPASATNGAP